VYRRLLDAVRTLIGVPNPDYVRWSQIGKLRTQVLEAQLDLSNTIEKLNSWAARQAKRESREAKELLDSLSAEQVAVQAEVAQGPKAYKQNLRSRAFARIHGGIPENGEQP